MSDDLKRAPGSALLSDPTSGVNWRSWKALQRQPLGIGFRRPRLRIVHNERGLGGVNGFSSKTSKPHARRGLYDLPQVEPVYQQVLDTVRLSPT